MNPPRPAHLLVTALALVFSGKLMSAEPMTLRDSMALSGPQPFEHIAYGRAPSQYVELFEPRGNGPFPVVLLVHGGCWIKQFGGIVQMRNVAGGPGAPGMSRSSTRRRRGAGGGGGDAGT